MAPRGIPEDLRPLENLSPDKSVYLGVDIDGDLLFRTDLSFIGRQTRGHLTERHLIALGLTDICCKLGLGKVDLHH